MVHSMTGFGSSESGGFRVEIRSLNHRFLEIYIKCPPMLARHEMGMRETLRGEFARGKLDVFITFSSGSGIRLRPGTEAAREILGALRELKEGLSLQGEIGLDTLLHWKEAIMEESAEYDPEALSGAFRKAVSELRGMRLREGEALASEVGGIVDRISALNDGVSGLLPSALDAARERFLARINEILPAFGRDDPRVLQEAASFAEKFDISEELARIRAHLAHMRKILSEGGTIGRKLDFLVQELHREANTIASKSEDTGILSRVISMKAEVERAREQVQNIQ